MKKISYGLLFAVLLTVLALPLPLGATQVVLAQGCQEDPPGSGNIVCATDDTDGFNDTTGNLDVTVNAGVSVENTNADVIVVGDDNNVTNNGDVQVDRVSPDPGDVDGIVAGDGNTIVNNGSIAAESYGGDGIQVDSNNIVENSGDITVNRGASNGIRADGSGNTIINHETGTIESSMERTGGIYTPGDNNTVTNDGTIALSGSQTTVGIQTSGSGNTFTNNGTITNQGTDADGIVTTAGDNTIVNTGTITTSGTDSEAISTSETFAGQDTITNTATGVITSTDAEAITTRGGNDQFNNAGTVNGDVNMGADNDVVNNTGTINGNLDVGDGDDTVTLGDGAVTTGVMDGGAGDDTLQFTMTVPADQIEFLAAQLVLMNGNTGSNSLTINGELYQWVNFENLVNLLQAAAAANGGVATIAVSEPFMFTDGRLNPFDMWATAVPYCAPTGGINVYQVYLDEGVYAFFAPVDAIHTALDQAVASGENVLVQTAMDVSLWALTSNQLQVNGPSGYEFIFNTNVCGVGR